MPTYTESPASAATSGGGIAWLNPTNVFSSNNTYATQALDGSTPDWLDVTDFGFAIPTNETVVGIKVSVERKADTSSAIREVVATLTELVAEDKSTSNYWPTSDGTADFGGAEDLWATNPTPADINSSGFGFRIRLINDAGGTVVASIDHVSITVYTALGQYKVTKYPTQAGLADFGDNITWGTPEEALTENSTGATSGPGAGQTTKRLYVFDYEFAGDLPADAVIRSMLIEILRADSGEATKDFHLCLVYPDGDTEISDDFADSGTTWPASYTWKLYRDDDGTFSSGLTRSVAVEESFGVGLVVEGQTGSPTPSVDVLARMTLYYDIIEDPVVSEPELISPITVPQLGGDPVVRPHKKVSAYGQGA